MIASLPLTTDAPPRRRYMTLEAARALECNGCGDCCDSSRTDGFWTWGALPDGQYRALNGAPLIIPLERVPTTNAFHLEPETVRPELVEACPEPSRRGPRAHNAPPHASGWRDRAWQPTDASEAAPTPFRCSAFLLEHDGGGLCGIHDRERPPQCGQFPVHTIGLEADIEARRVLHLETSAFSRCTWHRVDVVAADERALDAHRGCVDSEGYVALDALPPSLLARWGVECAPTTSPPAPRA